jgi:hypothetical protein
MSKDRDLARMDGTTKAVAEVLYEINAEDDRYPIIPPTAVPWIAKRIADRIDGAAKSLLTKPAWEQMDTITKPRKLRSDGSHPDGPTAWQEKYGDF